jgi:hypothetical protein
MKAQEIGAQLDAVLRSTGNAAGLTAETIGKIATHYQDLTRFEDDAIIAGQTVLLQFTNIGGKVFPQATKAMLDLSERMGIDIPDSAKIIGKALEGELGMLTRYGIVFDDATKKAIDGLFEEGKAVEAQNIILRELAERFGGAAQAAGQTFAGQIDRLNITFGNLKERIGMAVLPTLQDLADKLLTFVQSDEFQAWIEKAALWLENELPRAIQKASDFWTNQLQPAIAELWPILRDDLLPAFMDIARFLGVVMPPIMDAFIGGWKIQVGLFNLVKTAVENTINPFKKVWGWLDSIAKKLGELKLPDWLTPGSPTPLELGLKGINKQLQGMSMGNLALSPVAASAGGMGRGGGSPVIVNFNAPVLGFSDEYELANAIQAVMRRRNG